MYYRNADGAAIVFDVTDEASFQACKGWLKELEEKAPKNLSIIIVGNKSDLAGKEKVTFKQLQELALAHGVMFKMVSARANDGVQDVF